MDRKADSQCDFCSEANPRWCFPAQSFHHTTEVRSVRKVIQSFMLEDWAACDACCKAIHSGTRRELAERVYTSPSVRKSMVAILFKEELLSEVMKMQDVFRSNRLPGPPSMIRDR